MVELVSQTESFISSLKEWNKQTNHNQIQDYKTLIFILLGKLGDRRIGDFSEDDLRNRIHYLVNELKIDEDLLVTGLVNFVSEFLEGTIKRHGENILFHEEIVNSEQVIPQSVVMLERLKNLSYIPKAEKELEIWKKIVLEKMSVSNRRIWENQKMLSRFDKASE